MQLPKLKKLFNKKINGTGLAIFRICYFSVLFFEVKQLFFFRELIYGPFEGIMPSEINLGIALWFWMPICLMLVLGLFTRINTILNYFFSLVFIATIQSYEYHMFYVYMGINFLVMFIPISKTLSIDSIRSINHPNKLSQNFLNKKVSVWYYWILLINGLGFVYAGSIYFKLLSHNWMTGIGLWLPVSLPMIVTPIKINSLLNWKFGMLVFGYITIVYEFLFIFLFWFKSFRIPLLLIGLGLHLGITFFFPIPFFGLGALSILSLLMPNNLWNQLILFLKKLIQRLYYFVRHFWPAKFTIAYISSESHQDVLINQSPILRIWKTKGLILIFSIIIFLQLLYSNPLPTVIANKIGSQSTYLEKNLTNNFFLLKKAAKIFFGITGHPVFVDNHFSKYNHILSLHYLSERGEFIELPIINQQGNSYGYNSGFIWVKWSFRVVGPNIKQNQLEKGIKDFTAFWSKKNGINLHSESPKRFDVRVKKIEIPTHWEKDFKIRMEAKKWIDGGYIIWKDGKFSSNIKLIEKL